MSHPEFVMQDVRETARDEALELLAALQGTEAGQ